jgi:small subunit ribosomal protein S6
VKTYETMVVFDPTLDEARIGAKVEEIGRRVRDAGGEVKATKEWGKRKLAYPMSRKDNGVYVVLEYDAPGAEVAEIDRLLRLDDGVLRHMTVVGPDEALVKAAAEAAERSAQRRARTREEED